jgi:heat shock protein HtpX
VGDVSETPVPARTVCPRCGLAVVDREPWTTWCTGCDWNVLVGAPEPARGVLHRCRRRAVDRVGRRVYEDLLHGRPVAAGDRAASLLLDVVAVAVLVGLLLPGAAAVALALSPVTPVLRWPGVALLVGLLLAVLPRPTRVRDVVWLSREQAPAWWSLVDDVAAALATRPPQRCGVDRQLNAYLRRDGWRDGRVLVYGLALWSVEAPQERVATLAHEVGHLRWGDDRRSRVIWSAGQVLVRLVHLLQPSWLEQAFEDPELSAIEAVSNAVRRVVALPFVGLLVLMDRLDARDSQRREYRADRDSARVAGSAAARASLLQLLRADGIGARLQGAARRREDLWSALAAAPRPPQHELARLLRASELTGHRADDSHPPTHLRVGLVEGTEQHPTLVVLDTARRTAIERELAAARADLGASLTEDLLE